MHEEAVRMKAGEEGGSHRSRLIPQGGVWRGRGHGREMFLGWVDGLLHPPLLGRHRSQGAFQETLKLSRGHEVSVVMSARHGASVGPHAGQFNCQPPNP